MKINRYIRVLTTVATFFMLLHTTYAQTPSPVRELVRQSDFIGFVLADPNIVESRLGEGQQVDLYDAKPLKGFLKHDYGNGQQYPWMQTSGLNRDGLPTWFSDKGDYLVFGRLGGDETFPKLMVLAAFPVTYKPNALDAVEGSLFDTTTLPALSREQATLMLEETIRGTMTAPKPVSEFSTVLVDKTGTDFISSRNQSFLAGAIEDSVVLTEATNELDSYLGASGRALPTLQTVHIPTFEEREAQAKQLVASIRLGTSRAEIDKMFPQMDGGAMLPTLGRYYLGSEVMVNVPYENTGGYFSPKNKVNGPITIERSGMAFD